MRAFRSLLVAIAASSVGFAVVTEARAAAQAIKDFGNGAVGAFLDCIPQSDGDQLCEDFIVQYFVVRNTGFGTAVFSHSKASIHPDGSYDVFVDEYGFADDVPGTYDNSQLTFASMSAVELAMNDFDASTGTSTPNGRTAVLGPFEWTAASDPYVFPNDGPFSDGSPRHYVDHCLTQVYNTHEIFTTAYVAGTINGVSVTQYGPEYLPWPGTGPADALGAIFKTRITGVRATHPPGC